MELCEAGYQEFSGNRLLWVRRLNGWSCIRPRLSALCEDRNANLALLLPELGRKLICDLEARDVARYQQARLDEEASPKTVNLEFGTLRAILKRGGQWHSCSQK